MSSQKDKRISLRVSADLKALLSRAASYCGMPLATFVVSIAADRAKEIVAGHETITLTARDWEAFLSVLDDPERPRPRLEAGIKRYRERRALHNSVGDTGGAEAGELDAIS